MQVNVARVASAAALVVAIVAVLFVVTGSSSPYTVTAEFRNAGQIVKGDPVVIGAASVGRVASVHLTPDGLAALQLEIDGDTAPLRQGTIASIRANSLVGSANRYVSLAPPPGITPKIPDHGRLPLAETQTPVDLDAVLSALDTPTRQGLRQLLSGGAAEYAGRTAQAQQTIVLLAPALGGTSNVLSELSRDRPAFTRLLTEGGAVAGQLASRQNELADLITHAGTTAAAVGGQATALERTLAALPRTLRHGTATFAALRLTLNDFDRLVATATPATRRLTPFLAQLRTLLATGTVPIQQLADVVSTPGPGNDVTDALRVMPTLAGAVHRTYPQTVRMMNSSQDLLDTLRAYTPDIAGAVSNLGSASEGYDADGHYIRIGANFGALTFDGATNTLQPQPGFVDSFTGFETGRGHRCPGGAAQPPPDGSASPAAAAAQTGCDPSTVLPGP